MKALLFCLLALSAANAAVANDGPLVDYVILSRQARLATAHDECARAAVASVRDYIHHRQIPGEGLPKISQVVRLKKHQYSVLVSNYRLATQFVTTWYSMRECLAGEPSAIEMDPESDGHGVER